MKRVNTLILSATLIGGFGQPAMYLAASECREYPWTLPDTQLSVMKNLTYSTMGGTDLHLDVFKPTGDGPFPAVILLHGGGWRSGSKENMAEMARILASMGYAAIPVQYRLASNGRNRFLAAVQDARCAVMWIKDNADRLRIDEDRIAAAGASAGGHLASMLGTAVDAPDLDSSECSVQDQSAEVKAVIAIAGPQDLTVRQEPTEEQASILVDFLGTLPSQDLELARRASPAQYVDEDTPPFLLIHGTEDTLVPLSQAQVMRDKLTEAGREVTYLELEGIGHEATDVIQTRSDLRSFCVFSAFLEKHVKD